MNEVPRMLTLREGSAEANMPYSTLRKLCLSGEISHIRVGRKFYINADRLAEYLNGDN